MTRCKSIPPAATIVICAASSDRTHRKLAPELCNLCLATAPDLHSETVERLGQVGMAWQTVDPVVGGRETGSAPQLVADRPGAWGPPELTALPAQTGRQWHSGCGDHV